MMGYLGNGEVQKHQVEQPQLLKLLIFQIEQLGILELNVREQQQVYGIVLTRLKFMVPILTVHLHQPVMLLLHQGVQQLPHLILQI